MNCWEVKKCGRGPSVNGKGAQSLCPVAKPGNYDGINGGQFAGRFCWAVAGTLCNELKEQGAFVDKFRNCLNCNFLQQVDVEEGRFMVLTPYEIEMDSSEKVYS